MNYEKGWKELKAYIESLNALLPAKGDGYAMGLTILAHMEAMEKQPLFTVVHAIDTKERRLALVGHIADTNPSTERLDKFKANLVNNKLHGYLKKVYCPVGENLSAYSKEEWGIWKRWVDNEEPKLHKEVSARLEWHTEVREWKGKEEYNAIGEKIEN